MTCSTKNVLFDAHKNIDIVYRDKTVQHIRGGFTYILQILCVCVRVVFS